jgi:type II secretory pathway pseudopilin PulG
MKNLLEKINKKEAFSIIEIVVAIGVVSVGMLGVLSLSLQNIQTDFLNKNNLIASMLAQEGLEIVRQVRDSNWLGSAIPFADGIASSTIGVGTSTVDIFGVHNLDIVNDFTHASTSLWIDSNGFYQHFNSATSTIFKRLIVASSTAEYLSVKSIVRWTNNGRNHDYVAETLLYDWR